MPSIKIVIKKQDENVDPSCKAVYESIFQKKKKEVDVKIKADDEAKSKAMPKKPVD